WARGVDVIDFPLLPRSAGPRRLYSFNPNFHRTSFPSNFHHKYLSLPLKFPNIHNQTVRCFAVANNHQDDHHHHQDDHHHNHDHHHHHHHHRQHHHHHNHGDGEELSAPQKAFIRFAKAVGWVDLANMSREHLQLCCCSAALFVAPAACPSVMPNPVVKRLQNAFMIIAFPLVGVSASLDALTDVIGGKVNIHVLMALAAFASLFMGNTLEGGLLLAMFNLAHIGEYFKLLVGYRDSRWGEGLIVPALHNIGVGEIDWVQGGTDRGRMQFSYDFMVLNIKPLVQVTLIHLEDRPQAGVSNVIAELQDQARLRVMMLTGDHESSAWRVAKAVGITEVRYSLKPEDKLNHVKSISRNMGGGLIMVGEGINDAPALAAATVGIVLAQLASATAIAVADVLLLRDNISGVPFCIAKSRQTTSLVKQNVAIALTRIVLASLPSVLGFLPLWLTVLLHEGGTLLVCLNSIRALNDPKWSLGEDLWHLVKEFKSRLTSLKADDTISNKMQAAPL
ncbi:probable cadmium/zinc-transporting ATPase HMA1, chloroplastic, partial [Hevea brasiliensis]|uniref:probable cadmium/zinc-transporting ATPase HMA1, chloroplastic n=1 Tax=Hevea brasiliensis TaxID=3981 RepID=UPI0025F02DCD